MKSLSLLLLLLCSTFTCENELSEQVSTIAFSKNNTSRTETVEPEFANQFTLNKDQFLNIHFTLDQPLIHALQQLGPSLSEEELLAKGNFQFSFLVDGEQIYTENLNTGAGLKPFKTERLNFVIPLVRPEQIDWWGWFMWMRFMQLNGGQDALSEGNHTLSIEIRSYLKEDTLKVGPLLAKGEIAVDVPKIAIDESLVPVQKIQANSGWEISKDPIDRKKIEALNRKIAEKRFKDINSIVVIKNGELLLEEYFNGENRATLHNPRSVGKTIASSVMGIAIEENYIKDEQQQLKDFYDLQSYENYSPEKDQVRLKSLLTMSSGFLGDDDDMSNPGNEEYMYPTADWVKFALDQPMDKDKVTGKDYTYFTAGVVVLGDILHQSVPGGLVDYADKKLFAPLGITDYKWQYTPQNVGNTAGGIQLRAIDFAKYGQLYKNKGKWNGQQIIKEEWAEKSLSKQVSQAYAGIENGYYGYLFWNKVYTLDGKDYEVSFCTGNGGNKIFVFEDIPFVVVITASAYGQPMAHLNADKIMNEYILPAILTEQ